MENETNSWTDGTADWTTNGDWSKGAAPIATDNVVIDSGDPQVTSNVGTVASLTIDSIGDGSAELDIADGGRLAVSSAAGLGTTGMITGALGLTGTAGLQFASGQFAGIASGGALLLNGAGASVADAGQGQNSALALTSNAGALVLSNGASLTTPEALTNTGQIFINDLLGSPQASPSESSLIVNGTTAGFANPAGALDSAVVLGPNSLLSFTSGQFTGVGQGGALLLDGTTASVADAGQGLNSALAVTSNAGFLSLGDGATLTTLVTNSGSLSLTNSNLAVDGATTGFGTTRVNAAPGDLGSRVSVSGDSTLSFTSGQFTGIAIIGSLSLSGANASVADAGQAADSALALASNAGSLTLDDGATLATPGALSNTGSVELDNTTGTASPTTLTVNGSTAGFGSTTNGASPGDLASSVSVSGNSVLSFTSGQFTGIASSGSLSLGGAQASVADAGQGADSALALASNAGSLSLDDGASLATPGALTDTGSIDLSNTTGTANATTLTVNGSTAGFVDGTGALVGRVDVSGNSLLSFTGGQITGIAGSGSLSLGGAQASVADAGLGADSALELASNAGSLILNDGASLSTPGALTNTGSVDIANSLATTKTTTLAVNGSTAGFADGTGALAGQVSISGNSVLSFASGQLNGIASGGSLSLEGAASVSDVGQAPESALELSSVAGSLLLDDGASLATPGALTSTGEIILDNSLGTANTTTLTVNGTAAGFADATGALDGTVFVSGNSLLSFTSGQLNGIAAGGSLSLDGAKASVADAGQSADSALALSSNAGDLLLSGGAVLSTSGLTNTGSIQLSNSDPSSVTTLNIGGSATAFGTTPGELDGSVLLSGNSLLSFAGGGQITSIGAQGSLTLIGANAFIADASAPTSNSALDLNSIQGSLTLSAGESIATTGALSNTGFIDVTGSFDGPGAAPSTLTTPGVFDNEATVVLDKGQTIDAVGGYTQGAGETEVEGTLKTSSLSLASGSSFSEQIGGTATGSFGEIDATGAITLDAGDPTSGAELNVNFADGYLPTGGEQFDIIHNASGAPITGTFDGLAEGGAVSIDGSAFTISYKGGASGNDVVLTNTVTCYTTGTLIRTSRGDVPVEALVVGDLAVTAAGAARPISWLGHRTIDCRRLPDRAAALPVRIAAHAFGANRPARDLHVSPGHAICVDVAGEVLIPASSLVDGAIIAQVDVESVTYWHVELEGGHDILLAENLAAESYIDVGNRAFFVENGVTALAAMPDGSTRSRVHSLADYCRPFVAEGPLVAAVRARIAARAIAARRISNTAGAHPAPAGPPAGRAAA